MAHYFFQAQYRGAMLTDDIGEEFATLREAEAHATVVANEGHVAYRATPKLVLMTRLPC
jgi:hypothetical protein